MSALESRPAAAAWWALAVVLAWGGLVALWVPTQQLDWQPGLAWAQPWRWWTAAWVHWSPGHLAANLIGTALIALLGVRAHADRFDAWAWFAAWPLTQLGLLWQPELLHYGGLSGVLHAAVVIAAVALILREHGTRRWVGVAIVLGAALKVTLEQPWHGALRHAEGWSIAIAPAAHLSGALAGLACAGGAAVWRHRMRSASRGHGMRNA